VLQGDDPQGPRNARRKIEEPLILLVSGAPRWTKTDADDVEITSSMRGYSGDFPIAVHPGELLQEMLDERGISQVELAQHLNTDVARINEICRRRRGVSAQMAVLLGKAFGTSAGLWLNLQKNWGVPCVRPPGPGDQGALSKLRCASRSPDPPAAPVNLWVFSASCLRALRALWFNMNFPRTP
jgi:addiction module HigA family antidote